MREVREVREATGAGWVLGVASDAMAGDDAEEESGSRQ